MKYPAKFTPDEEDGGYVVTFRDIQEAITQGDTFEEAMEMAEDVIAFALKDYFDKNHPIPLPSKPERGEHLVSLPASVAAKVLLLNEMIAQNVKQAELARRLGVRPTEVTRMVNLQHATKIERIDAALKTMGKSLELRIGLAIK